MKLIDIYQPFFQLITAFNFKMSRASGRASAKIKYTEEDEDDDEEEEDEEDFEDEVPLKARKVAKQAKGRSAAVSKQKEPEVNQNTKSNETSPSTLPLNIS